MSYEDGDVVGCSESKPHGTHGYASWDGAEVICPGVGIISKTTFTFTVLHRTDEPFNDNYDSGYDEFAGALAEAMQRSFDGNAVGAETSSLSEPIPDSEVPNELIELLGNDGEFFDDDLEREAGEDLSERRSSHV